MKIKNLKKILCHMMVLLMLAVTILPMGVVSAEENSTKGKTIKVFLPLQKGFVEIDKSGEYHGYTYEYLMKIAQLTGWWYEFVSVENTNESLSDGLDKVSRGELDLAGAMNYSDVLAEKYEYSTAYGEANYTLLATKNNSKINTRTLLDFENLRVAMVKGADQENQAFDNFSRSKALTYEPIYVEKKSECYKLVEAGNADILISKDVADYKGFKVISEFSPTPFYFAASKGNKDLARDLNRALTMIETADPTFQEKLHDKYFSTLTNEEMQLTVNEREYLKKAPVLCVAVPIGRAPVQDYDESTGEFSGITIDIMEAIFERSGLKFELFPVEDMDLLKKDVANDKYDIIAGVSNYYDKNQGKEDSSSVLRSLPIFSFPIVRISNKDKVKENSKTLVAGSIKLFEGTGLADQNANIEKIFELVNSGEYGEAYVNGYMAQHMLEKNYYKNISMTFTPYGSIELCLGVSRESDLRLISVLDQAISTLQESEVNDMIYSNTNHKHSTDIWTMIRRDPTQIAVPVFITLMIIVSLLLLLMFRTRKLNKLISREKNEYKIIAQTDRLSKAYNNAAFKQHANNYVSQEEIPICGALILCDIDDFKNINDTYGHLKGDEVINKLGILMADIFHKDDIIGRLGGDEFAVLLKGISSRESITRLCSELQEKSKHIIEENEVTLSIGLAVFDKSVDFNSLFEKADKALYQVKREGKDSYKIYNDNNLL